jgi:hypothetical protein
MNNLRIKHEFGRYAVYDGQRRVATADTHAEAMQEVHNYAPPKRPPRKLKFGFVPSYKGSFWD